MFVKPQENGSLDLSTGENRERGFSMVEILITLAITLIGMTGVLSLHTTLARTNQIATQQSEASSFGEESLEDLRSQPAKQIVQTYGGDSPIYPITVPLAQAQGRAGQLYDRTLTISQVAQSEHLLRMRVEVSWAEGRAALGSDEGKHDHVVAFEVVRALSEAL